MTFDQVLPTLVRICEQVPEFLSLKRACVVRDLRGRVRLILDPEPQEKPVDTEALTKSLSLELRDFFAAPIWSTRASKHDEARLARAILGQAEDWNGVVYEDPTTGSQVAARVPWKKLERRLSKQEWLETAGGKPPWELSARMPGIVTFYSFKGGVGRTTALAACAWQLARARKRVAIIDLDLEAPGIGTLLEVESERGVVDFLVDHIATGAAELSDLFIGNARAFGADSGNVEVVPAGKLSPGYLEKLGRSTSSTPTPQQSTASKGAQSSGRSRHCSSPCSGAAADPTTSSSTRARACTTSRGYPCTASRMSTSWLGEPPSRGI